MLADIRHTTVIHAPIQKVWDAVATSGGVAGWFMPNDLKAEEGHEFQLNAAQFGKSQCKVTKVDSPHIFSFLWGKDWSLTFELKEQDDKTEISIVHSGWDEDKVTEFGAPHKAVRENMNQGWAGLIQKLKAYAES